MSLVEDNINIAHYVAHEYENKGIDYEDLVSIAVVGIVKAEKMFDASLGYKFSTFATKCARMEILHQFRQERRNVDTVSFEQPLSGDLDNITVESIIEDDNDWVEKFIEREDLAKAMNELTDREKRVLKMYYVTKMKRIDIMKKMGRSGQTCDTIKKRALEKLRNAMA